MKSLSVFYHILPTHTILFFNPSSAACACAKNPEIDLLLPGSFCYNTIRIEKFKGWEV